MQITKRTKVLVAEDDLTCQFIIGQMLNRFGCVYDSVENGELAVEAALKNEYDIILMDLDMPKMNGISATKQIRRLYQEGASPIIIALTGCIEADNKIAAKAAGMQDFVAKPLDEKKLQDAIRIWTHKSRAKAS